MPNNVLLAILSLLINVIYTTAQDYGPFQTTMNIGEIVKL